MTSPKSLADLIGNTPILKLTNMDTGPCELFVKLENQNPGGSIKDRGGRAMIEAAEQAGDIAPGDTLIEATTGNAGLGLSLAALHKGYSLVLVIPDNVSRDKILHLIARGVEVRLTRADVDPGHPEHYRNIARRLEQELPRGFYLNQYGNPANPRAYEQELAPEIWEQMQQRVDAFVCGVGTGGTITGCARFLKRANPDVDVVLADPEGSVFAASVRPGQQEQAMSSTWVEDVGGRSVPDNFDPSLVDQAYTITQEEAFSAAKELLQREGVFGGVSTGVHIAAATKYCRAATEPKRVVTLVCDIGQGYLSTAYDRSWALDSGLVHRNSFGDLRDLITHRADKGEVVSITPDDTVLTAYTRIRMFDVSQLPVLEQGRIVGMIDESDLLMAVFDNRQYFDYPVRDFMITRLEKIRPSASIASLLPVFRGDHVAIIADDETFYGLVTQVDLIAHLRHTMSNHS